MNKIKTKKEEDILSHVINLVKLSAMNNSEILKARYLQELFLKIGYEDTVIDTAGNVIAKLKGKKQDDILLVCSNLDNEEVSGETSLTFKNIVGKGVGEAGISLFALVFLAEIFKTESLDKTIYFIGTAGSRKGNLGLNSFLDSLLIKPKGLINIEGLCLGEVNKKNINLLRYRLEYRGSGGHAWKDIGGGNPIFAMSGTICQLKDKIKENETILNIATVNSESPFEMIPDIGHLELEIRGFYLDELEKLGEEVKQIAQMAAKHEEVELEIKEVLKIEGTASNKESRLEKIFLEVNRYLNISSYSTSSNFEIAPALLKGIDAVSVGVAMGGKINKKEEYALISSIYKGMEQLYEAVIKFDKN